MKILHLSTLAIFLMFVLINTNLTFAEMQLNNAILIPFKDSEVVLVGKVIEVNTLSENKTQYSVAVEKYLKNEKPFGLITAVGDGIRTEITDPSQQNYFNQPVFEKGDRVFLYLNQKDGQYVISPFSFLVSRGDMAHPPGIATIRPGKNNYYGNEEITILGVIEKGYMYTSAAEYGANSTVSIVVTTPKHEKFLTDIVDVKPDGTFVYQFKIKGKLGITGTYEADFGIGSAGYGTTFDYVADPLNQFKSGIAPKDVACKKGLNLIIKAEDGSTACVKPDTAQKLIERGWAIKNTSLNYSRVPTKISSQVFPTNAALSVGEPSVKGYLTSTDGSALPNKQINIIIDNATFENGTSIENILLGKTFTDQDGCFYLAGWDQDAADRFQKDMAEKTPRFAPTDIVSIKAVFTGDSKYQGSSNATKFIYYTVAVPIIRPAISAFLVNGSDIVLEKGKSYNFTDFSTWGEALQLHTLSIEMKNLPCGIYETTREISVADNQTQVIMPIELRVEKTAPVGNFTTYISVNNQALEPINLEIK